MRFSLLFPFFSLLFIRRRNSKQVIARLPGRPDEHRLDEEWYESREKLKNLLRPDKMPLLHGGKGGDSRRDGNWN